jgi:hypothetical protein
VRVIQRIQVLIQDQLLSPALASSARPKPPWPMRLIASVPWLRSIPARILGVGVRPEHVRTPVA